MLIFFGSSKLWPWINSRHCFSHFLPSLKIESGYSGWWLYGTLAWDECYTRAAASNQGPATLLSNGVAKSSFVDQMSSWRIIIRSNWKILLCCFCHVHFDEDIYIHCIGNIPITKRCWQLTSNYIDISLSEFTAQTLVSQQKPISYSNICAIEGYNGVDLLQGLDLE